VQHLYDRLQNTSYSWKHMAPRMQALVEACPFLEPQRKAELAARAAARAEVYRRFDVLYARRSAVLGLGLTPAQVRARKAEIDA
jgi:hypothetical protein